MPSDNFLFNFSETFLLAIASYKARKRVKSKERRGREREREFGEREISD